ncbi:MAG: protein kinase [Bradymonadaceae bacterium]|nr:protein kinase [Lujinxingiaceae bacterium]
MALLDGKLLEGRYLLESKIGEGGMGAVYLATQLRVGRKVAVKFLHGAAADSASARKRFEIEAQAIGRLNHPNCITLFDFGYSEELDALYTVVEFIEGDSLFKIVGQRLPMSRVVRIMRQVAAAIDHAHANRIIHRDLKPENIMLSVDSLGYEHVKVLDFGIARLVEEGSPDEKTQIRLTRTGSVFGTPPYMSPEQVLGKSDVTHLTDLYSLGVMLYELVTGHLPFQGVSPLEVALMHVKEPVPPITRADVPESLKRIVFHLLEKAPQDRFQTCGELIMALDGVDLSAEVSDEHHETMELGHLASNFVQPTSGGLHARPAASNTGSMHQANTENLSPAAAQASPAAAQPTMPPAKRALPSALIAVVVVLVLIVSLGALMKLQSPSEEFEDFDEVVAHPTSVATQEPSSAELVVVPALEFEEPVEPVIEPDPKVEEAVVVPQPVKTATQSATTKKKTTSASNGKVEADPVPTVEPKKLPASLDLVLPTATRPSDGLKQPKKIGP